MRIGFDIGGTFTDVIGIDAEGGLYEAKVLSLLEGLGSDIREIAMQWTRARANERFEELVHGTTIASNAVIEGTVARTGLITTAGFRDVLEMRGQRRPGIYDINWSRLPSLVPRQMCVEVKERILADGTVDLEFDELSARFAIDQLISANCEAIAICLINAYISPLHELRIANLAADMAPEIPVCLSSSFHPEIREYERTSTTVINASLIPLVRRYLDDLQEPLSKLTENFLLMQSNGGVMTAAAARDRPACIMESGPAAGVLACASLSREVGLEHVLSFDMGGTTAKACLVEGGSPLEKSGGEVGGGQTMTERLFGGTGHALRIASLDIVEVGAGGGSIAWVDQGGVLHVGPRSSGAKPGPACYGRGGTSPTVTDANVVLGYMDRGSLAQGRVRIDKEASRRVLADEIAAPLKMSLQEAAFGIHMVANAAMMRALRAVSTERGRDPRYHVLMAFGGAGPVHAAHLAETLRIGTVYIPLHPGLFSALGLLLADHRRDEIRSVASPLETIQPELLERLWNEMEVDALSALQDQMIGEQPKIERFADLCYKHQLVELTLPMSSDLDPSDLGYELGRRFAAAHREAYGFESNDPVMVVSLRLRATAPGESMSLAQLAGFWRTSKHDDPQTSTREAYFGAKYGLCRSTVMSRHMMRGDISGPLIIEDPDTTVVVPPGWSAHLDAWESMVLRWGE